MTQSEQIVETFKTHGWRMTLGELLEIGRFSFAHKLTARLSDLRAKGYRIECEKGPNPSKNLYKMNPPVDFNFDESGQGSFS